MRANKLPIEEQKRLRNILRHELTNQLIEAVKASSPQIDLDNIDIVLGPAQELTNWNTAGCCCTCGTCCTCVTCCTCSTCCVVEEIPDRVVKELNLKPKVQMNVKQLENGMNIIKRQIDTSY